MAQHVEALRGHDGVVHHAFAALRDDLKALGVLREGKRDVVAGEYRGAVVGVLGDARGAAEHRHAAQGLGLHGVGDGEAGLRDGVAGRLGIHDAPAFFVGAVEPFRDLHRLHRPAAKLAQHVLGDRWDDLVVEGAHALAAHLQVEAGDFAGPALRRLLGGSGQQFLGNVFADHIHQILLGVDGTVDRSAVADLDGVEDGILQRAALVVGVQAHGADLLAQVVPVCALLPRHESHLVVAAVHGHLHDALQGQGHPGVGLADEGCCWHQAAAVTGSAAHALIARFDLGHHSVLHRRVHRGEVLAVDFARHFLRRGLAVESALLAFLAPIRLHLFHEQHPRAAGVGAVVEADVGEDVGLVPVAAAVQVASALRCLLVGKVNDADLGARELRAPPLRALHRPLRRQFAVLPQLRTAALGVLALVGRQRQQHLAVVGAAGEGVVGVLGVSRPKFLQRAVDGVLPCRAAAFVVPVLIFDNPLVFDAQDFPFLVALNHAPSIRQRIRAITKHRLRHPHPAGI